MGANCEPHCRQRPRNHSSNITVKPSVVAEYVPSATALTDLEKRSASIKPSCDTTGLSARRIRISTFLSKPRCKDESGLRFDFLHNTGAGTMSARDRLISERR